MDKFYFDGSQTGVSRELRRLYSTLTNKVYLYLDGELTDSDVRASMQLILDIQAPVPEAEINRLIKEQLQSCALYWEDHNRYIECWPTISHLITKPL